MRIRGGFILLAIHTTWSLTALAVAGTFWIQSSDAPCRCDGTVNPDLYHFKQFVVMYTPSGLQDCAVMHAAFRIQGVPDDPALLRRFVPTTSELTVTGDVFGEGAIVDMGQLPPAAVGYISLFVEKPLDPHLWSIEAHQGLEGVTTPVADFLGAPGVWVPQTGLSTLVGAPGSCDACAQFAHQYCPFAVQATPWSGVKALYR